MAYINRINKKLDKLFGGSVKAREEDGLLILSGELKAWKDVVYAGRISVNKRRYKGLINDITCTGEAAAPIRHPGFQDDTLNGLTPDVLIIGGGVVGCAIARELTRHKLGILLVDKEADLALHTSSRNDGMVHSGIDLKNKKSLKHRYLRTGNRMFADICADLGVDFDRCGQYLFFNKLFIVVPFLFILIYWRWLGIKGVRILGKKSLRKREPNVSSDICWAVYIPSSGIVCPYNLAIAYAENAVKNGAKVSLNTIVESMEVKDGLIKNVKTNRGIIKPKAVVNAAGVFCEDIAKMADDRFYSVHPRKGTNIIIDKKYRSILTNTAVSIFGTADKAARTKGGGIMRTVSDNILVGPDAAETIEKEDNSTTRKSITDIITRQQRTCPNLKEHQVITYFSGTRAATYEEDFVVCKGRANMVHAAGIQSPGLTAAPAIGIETAKIVTKLLGCTEANPDFDPVRISPPRPAKLDDDKRRALIAENPDYGTIICRCEEVSKGEIIDALRRNIPCDTTDGIKRRVRPGMGRCQGGFCGPLVLDIIAKEKGLKPNQVRKSGTGSVILLHPTKGEKTDD